MHIDALRRLMWCYREGIQSKNDVLFLIRLLFTSNLEHDDANRLVSPVFVKQCATDVARVALWLEPTSTVNGYR